MDMPTRGKIMKKVMIEGKEYWQQEECDIPKISMPYPRDLLTSYQPERASEKARKGCGAPNTPTKGSESSRND
jgi:hypothetical protein